MAKTGLPSISVVIPTYDGSARVLDKCLRLVRGQDYPQQKIEIILGDGSTSSKNSEIAKKYQAKVIKIPLNLQHSEYNRGVAFNQAKNELVLILDNDNFLPLKTWLGDMVEPILNHPEVVAVETCFYHYDKSFDLLDRYFALFGVSEPLPFYLKKADRMPWKSKKWTLQGKAKDMGKYYLVKFEKDIQKIPTIGTNGCLMRRRLVIDNAKVDPKHHYPIDVMVDVIKSGHNQFAFVKNSIIHQTGYSGFLNFLQRRFIFAEKYHFQDMSRRRYSVYTPKDFWQVAYFVFISLTLVKPTADALVGFVRIPDLAWFLHPVLAFVTTIMYGFITAKNYVTKKL